MRNFCFFLICGLSLGCNSSSPVSEPAVPVELNERLASEIIETEEEADEFDFRSGCYNYDENRLAEAIVFIIEGDSVHGSGQGELFSENLQWSFDFDGIMVDSIRAILEVTFHNEGGEEIVQEEWLIYNDSLRILGNARGTDGPYLLPACE